MSAPPIRIESKAWTDSRYVTLALELGLPASENDTALIRCAAIWRWQTEHYSDEAPTYVVSAAVVNGCLKSLDGARALLAADLAELEPDGRLRIRGGRDDEGKSRISWLWDDRQQRREAGKASAARRKAAGDPRAPRGRFGDLGPTVYQRSTNGRPTTTERATERPPSSLVSGLRTPEIPDSLLGPAGARDPGSAEPPPCPVPLPEAEEPPNAGAAVVPGAVHAPILRLVRLAGELLNAARAEVDREARPITVTAGDEMAAAGHLRTLPEAEREPAIRHGVAVLAELVRVGKRPIGDLRPGELFGPRSWGQHQANSVESIRATARGRDGPAGRPPPRKTGMSAALAVAARIRATDPATEPDP